MNDISCGNLLFADEDILVLDKPGGLRTIPDGYDKELPCVRDMLTEKFGKAWVVHRLDKDTSGVLVFARNAQAHRSLNLQFEHRQIHKEYRAVVCGSPMWDQRIINIPLLKNGDREHRTTANDIKGKKALSRVEVIVKNEQYTFLSITIESVITHQIRAHLALYGFPIIGDALYGRYCALLPTKNRSDPSKLLLHATSISFFHPRTGESMHVQSLLPPYFTDYVKNI